jgi:hypothetical protein
MQGDALEDVNAQLNASQRAKLWLCERFLKDHPHRWFTLPEVDLHVPRGVPISQFPLRWLQGMLRKTEKNQFQCWKVALLPTQKDNGETNTFDDEEEKAPEEDDGEDDAPRRIPAPERVQFQYAPIRLETSTDVTKALRAATRVTDQGVLGIGGENFVPTPRAVECVEAALRQNSVVMMRKDPLGKELKESMLAMARLGGRGMETEIIVEYGQRATAAGSPAAGTTPVGSTSAASASRGFGNNTDFSDFLTSDAKIWFQECPVRFWFSVRDPLRGTTYSQAGIPTLFTPGVVYTLSIQRRVPVPRTKPASAAAGGGGTAPSSTPTTNNPQGNPSSSTFKSPVTETYSLTKMLDAVFAVERPAEEEDLAETLQHYPLQVAFAVQGNRGRGNQILNSITVSRNAVKFEPLTTVGTSSTSSLKQPRIQTITIEAREHCKGHFLLQIQPLPAPTSSGSSQQPATTFGGAGRGAAGGAGSVASSTTPALLRDPSKLLPKSQAELPIPFEVLRRSLLVDGERSLRQFVFHSNESTPVSLIQDPAATGSATATQSESRIGLINPGVIQQCLQQHLFGDPELTRPSSLDTALEHLEHREREMMKQEEKNLPGPTDATSSTIHAQQALAKRVVSDAVALRWADYPSPTFAMAKLSVPPPSADQLKALADTMFVEGTIQRQDQFQQGFSSAASQKGLQGKRKRGRKEGDDDGEGEGKLVAALVPSSASLQSNPIRLRNHHMKNRGFVFTEPYTAPSAEGGIKLQLRSRRTATG